MLFELSSFEWRKIDAEIPVEIGEEDWYESVKRSVCVNSVIHLMLQHRNEILAFDLRTEMFEIIKIPNEALPCEDMTVYNGKRFRTMKSNKPILMKVNGFLGELCHDRVVESNEMDIWMLKDYKEHVWVKETIVFG
nr:hypothetical protein [Tanacetum cinerariifolium]